MPDQSTWKFINTFAPWLSAAGTILATVVALYLGLSGRREKLQVSAGVWLSIGGGVKQERFVRIGVTNVGHNELILQNVGWRVSWLKKQHALQMLDISPALAGINTKQLPCKLAPGDAWQYLIPVKYFEANSEKFFDTKLQHVFPAPHIRSLKVVAGTTRGKTFYASAFKEVRKLILDVKKSAKKPPKAPSA